jgi:lipopolysaccharide export system permease protein
VSVLAQLMIRRHLFLLTVVSLMGLAVYVFVELFDRLDDFLEARVPLQLLGMYLLARAPFILAQIFPAAVLLATGVQLALMDRARELVALRAGGIAPWQWQRVLIACAIVLAGVHFFLSQGLGTWGHGIAERIWQEEVRGRRLVARSLENLWFREPRAIVHLQRLTPASRSGQGITVYELDPQGHIQRIISGHSVEAQPGAWTLTQVQSVNPTTFAHEEHPTYTIPLAMDPQTFVAVDSKVSLDSLSFWILGREVERLRQSGANVSRLETAWHMKFAQSAAVVVMAVLALGVAEWVRSPYAVATVGLILSFAYYGFFVLCSSAAQQGLLPPVVGAWATHLVVAWIAVWNLAVRRLREGR